MLNIVGIMHTFLLTSGYEVRAVSHLLSLCEPNTKVTSLVSCMVGVVSCPLLITKYLALCYSSYNSVHSLRMRICHVLQFMRFVAWGYVSISVRLHRSVCIMITSSIIKLLF